MANTYWVSFEWTCSMLIGGEWSNEVAYDSHRFQCSKNDILKNIKEEIQEEFNGIEYKNLKVKILDCYRTTDYEV